MRWYFTLSLGLLLVVAPACHFSVTTANISDLKLGTDKSVSQPTSNFKSNDTVYAVAEISDVPSAVKVKGRLVIDNVEGEESGPVPGAEKTLDMTDSGEATFTFSAPATGWPPGKYKIEVFMMDSDGTQKDQKTANFSVS